MAELFTASFDSSVSTTSLISPCSSLCIQSVRRLYGSSEYNNSDDRPISTLDSFSCNSNSTRKVAVSVPVDVVSKVYTHGCFNLVDTSVPIVVSGVTFFLRFRTANIFRFDLAFIAFDSTSILVRRFLLTKGFVSTFRRSVMFRIGKSNTTFPLEPRKTAASWMGNVATPIGMVVLTSVLTDDPVGDDRPTINSKFSRGTKLTFQAFVVVVAFVVINVVSNKIVESAVEASISPLGVVVALIVLLSQTAIYRRTGRGCGRCFIIELLSSPVEGVVGLPKDVDTADGNIRLNRFDCGETPYT